MTVLTRKTYRVTCTFPSGQTRTVNIIHYTKPLAIKTFLGLFCRGKK